MIRSYWRFYFTVIAHGLDRFGNFSHYTYPTIPLCAHTVLFFTHLVLSLLSSSLSRLYYPHPQSTLLFLFSFPRTLHTSFSYGALPDVQTIPFSPYIYSVSFYIRVARSHILSSNFWLSFAVSSHGVYFCRAFLHEITSCAELYSIKLLGKYYVS